MRTFTESQVAYMSHLSWAEAMNYPLFQPFFSGNQTGEIYYGEDGRRFVKFSFLTAKGACRRSGPDNIGVVVLDRDDRVLL